jgi:hypothetical protein
MALHPSNYYIHTHTEYLHVHTVERAHTLEHAHTQLEWSYSLPVGIRTGKPASVQTSMA